jgi:hypothetical protein
MSNDPDIVARAETAKSSSGLAPTHSSSWQRAWTTCFTIVGLAIAVIAGVMFLDARSKDVEASRINADAWMTAHDIARQNGVDVLEVIQEPQKPTPDMAKIFLLQSQSRDWTRKAEQDAETKATIDATYEREKAAYDENIRLFTKARQAFRTEDARSQKLRRRADEIQERAAVTAVIASAVFAAGLLPLVYVKVIRPSLVITFRASRAVREVSKAEFERIEAKSRE